MRQLTVDWRAPILLCELPLDGSRFTGKLPPVTTAPSFTIRRHAVRVFSLADYVEATIMSAAQAADDLSRAREVIVATARAMGLGS
jgi:type IV secretion system protein VirB11